VVTLGPHTIRDTAGRVLSPSFALIALPFLLLTVNISWILTYPETVDGWVYFGFFENPRSYLHAFAGTYYSTRLSWILPGAVVHQVLPDLQANFVLHIGLYCAGLLAIYSALKRTAGERAALLAAILLGTYSYYLYSIGWNYVDGAGIVYYSLAIALMTRAASSPRLRIMVVVAGVAFAGAVHTNILWLALTVPFLYYAVRVRRPDTITALALDAAAFTGGVVFCTAVLGVINVWLGSDFLFFRPSFAFAASTVLQPSAYHRGGWVLNARWLIFPTAVFVSTAAWRALGIADTRARALVDHFLLACVVFVLLQLAGRPVLELTFSSSYLMPAMALAAGAQLAAPLRKLSGSQYARIVIVALVCCVGAYSSPLASGLFKVLWPVPLVAMGLVLAAIGLVARIPQPAAIIGLLLTVSVVTVGTADGHAFDFTGRPTRLDSFRAILQATDVLDDLDPAVTAKFWYSEASPYGPVYEAVSSTRLWGYRLVGTRFPSLWNPIILKDTTVNAGDRVVILSEAPKPLELAEPTLERLHMSAMPVTERVVEDGTIRFHLVVADLVATAP
jgi:hypothetical protein